MIPVIREHSDAMIALLMELAEPVGDADAADLVPPYRVVYRGPSRTDGPLDRPNDDGFLLYQVSCVGESRMAADGLADETREKVLTSTPVVEGRYIARIEHVGSRGADRDEVGGEKWFTAVEEFRVWTTPGGEVS